MILYLSRSIALAQGVRFNLYPGAKWLPAAIPYSIHTGDFTATETRAIHDTVSTWNTQVSCIKSEPYRSGNKATSLKSKVKGTIQFWQPMYLGHLECISGNMVFSFLKQTIGFTLENNRSDRDKYIKVIYENVQGKYQTFYKKNFPRIMDFKKYTIIIW